jgi:hypothetical protein
MKGNIFENFYVLPYVLRFTGKENQKIQNIQVRIHYHSLFWELFY